MDESFTIKEFITAEKISISFFYRLAAAGKAPRTYHVGGNRRITRADWEAWRAHRLAAVAPPTSKRGRRKFEAVMA